MSHLGDLFRKRREAAGLERKDVARATGCRSFNKQVRTLAAIEEGRDLFPQDVFLERFARILGIDEADIVQAMALDHEVLDRPIRPYLTIRLIPGFYATQSLPDDCTPEKAKEIAQEVARTRKVQVCLHLSRLRALLFHPDGCEGEVPSPAMEIGGAGRQAVRFAKCAASVPRE